MSEWTKQQHMHAREVSQRLYSGDYTRSVLADALAEIERLQSEVERTKHPPCNCERCMEARAERAVKSAI